MATDVIRVGVVGRGAIGAVTCAVLESLPRARLAWAASARDPGAWAWDDVDAVAVCSPNGLHVEHALAAVRAGKHAVVEKPLALDVASGSALLAEAERVGVRVAVISQRRFEPAVRAARAAIASGALGRLVLSESLVRWHRSPEYFTASPWRGTRALDGGVLFNQGIHVLDLALWLGGPVVSVTAREATRVRAIEAPDTIVASLVHASGAPGSLAMTVAAADGRPAELNLFFERGTIRLADDRVAEWSVPGIAAPEALPSLGSGSGDPGGIGNEGHRRQWSAVVDALLAGEQPEVTGADALATVAVAEAIHRSAAQGGRPVSLP